MNCSFQSLLTKCLNSYSGATVSNAPCIFQGLGKIIGIDFCHSSLLMHHRRSCLLALLHEMQSAVHWRNQEKPG